MIKTITSISALLGDSNVRIRFKETTEVLEISPSSVTRLLHVGAKVYLDRNGKLSLL